MATARLATVASLLVALAARGPAVAGVVPGTGGRIATEGWVDGLAVVGTDGGPNQRPQALGALRLDAPLGTSLRGHLELRSRAGGPFMGGHPDVYNFVHTFQNDSPSLEFGEAYLDAHLRHADLRVGIQKLAWGRLDGIPPTDVLNPRDLHDPFVADLEEAKIGIPALQGTWHLGDIPRLALSQLRATLVYVPIAVPPRNPLLLERWFPESALPPPSLVLRKEDVELVVDRELARRCARGEAPESRCNPPLDLTVREDVAVPVSVHTSNRRPPLRLDSGGIAARLAGSWRDMDWDLYHYTGPETGPDADLRVEIVSRSPLWSPSTLPYVTPRLSARATLRQALDIVHMTGADWAATFGAVTLRAEVAFSQNRPYLRIARDLTAPAALRRLSLPRSFFDQALGKEGCKPTHPCRGSVSLGELFPTRDAVEWGVGADYFVGGFLPLLQVTQLALLESAPRLVVNDPETRLTALVRKRLLRERLELEVRGVYALERGAWFVFPRASYLITDAVRVRLGYLALGGTRNSLFGQFGRNDEVVMQVRYSF